MNKSGASKGGKVHWFALMLPRITSKKYDVICDNNSHNYFMQFKTRFKNRYDEYIIIRTSEKCYRVTYYDKPTNFFEYTSFRKAEDVIDYILYRLPIKLQQEDFFQQDYEHKKRRKTLKNLEK